MTHDLLSLHNVCFKYSDSRRIISDVSLTIRHKELLVISGASGAGKSTFLKLLNRFHDITDGKILYHGRELREYHVQEVRRSILYLPQLPSIIEGSVEDNLSFPFSFQVHKHKKFSPDRAQEWLAYFQLNVALSHDASKLSVGQRQRIALIRALLLDPEVLLLDEPCSSLDSRNRRRIEEKIESLLESAGITVIMATHGEVGFSEPVYSAFHLEDGKLRALTK